MSALTELRNYLENDYEASKINTDVLDNIFFSLDELEEEQSANVIRAYTEDTELANCIKNKYVFTHRTKVARFLGMTQRETAWLDTLKDIKGIEIVRDDDAVTINEVSDVYALDMTGAEFMGLSTNYKLTIVTKEDGLYLSQDWS